MLSPPCWVFFVCARFIPSPQFVMRHERGISAPFLLPLPLSLPLCVLQHTCPTRSVDSGHCRRQPQPLPKRPQVPASFNRRRGRQRRVAPACAIGGTQARRRRRRPTTGAEAKASGAIRSAGIARRATLLEKAIQRGRSTLGGQRCLPMPPASNCGVGACALNNHY